MTSKCFTLTHLVSWVIVIVRSATAVMIVRSAEGAWAGSPKRSVGFNAAPADRLAAERVNAAMLGMSSFIGFSIFVGWDQSPIGASEMTGTEGTSCKTCPHAGLFPISRKLHYDLRRSTEPQAERGAAFRSPRRLRCAFHRSAPSRG